jgi:cytochrome c oxidase assembly factor CtaG
MRRSLPLIAALGGPAAPAHAAANDAATGWTAWFGDPVTAVALGLLLAWYVAGAMKGAWRPHRTASIGDGRMMAFFAGVALTGFALLSPIDAFGERLFAVHMAQHLLLIIGSAPLFAISNAHLALAAALPRNLRQRLAHSPAVSAVLAWSQRPAAAWTAATAFVMTIWLWHVPAAHDFATGNGLAHAAEHLTVLIAATLFWRVVLTSGYRRLSRGMAALMVSLVGLSGSLLSALIMFAPQPLCRAYVHNPIEDQVLAGLLMCIPASFVYLGSTLWALWHMLAGEGTHAR